MLHCAIFLGTCLAMLINVALQVAEVGCYTTTWSQQLAIFLARWSWSWGELEYPELLGTKNDKCAHARICALVISDVKLWEKLLEGWYTVQWCCQLLQSVAVKSRAELFFVQRLAQQQKIAIHPITCYMIVHFYGSLSRNGIAKQIAEKIAHCNRA